MIEACARLSLLTQCVSVRAEMKSSLLTPFISTRDNRLKVLNFIAGFDAIIILKFYYIMCLKDMEMRRVLKRSNACFFLNQKF